jgi:N-acetylneuraminic acid mutarotase
MLLGIRMNKSIVLQLVLVFLTASLIIVAKPISATASVENSWTSKAPMLTARSGLGVAVVNGKIYAIGGSTEAGQYGATTGGIVGLNEEFDPATNTWTSKKPMPTPRYGFAIAVYNNKIFCIGGENRAGYTGANEVYDPATDTWETKTSSSYPRYGISANVVGNKIYVIGGFTGEYFPTLNEVYYPENDSWATKAPIPTSVSDYASAVFDKRIYIIQSTTQIYDTENNTWSLGESPPSSVIGRAGQTSGVNAPERIYALSWDSDVNQIYAPENESWTFGAYAQIPMGMGGFGVAVVKDLLYLIGGSTLTYDPDIPPTSPLAAISTKYAINEMYTPFGYGAVPPKIAIAYPENATYTSGNVSLDFTVNKQSVWLGYSIDGQENITVGGNVTLTGLSAGLHNITVYAKDEFGNIGTSETVTFNVANPFPIAPVAAASGASVAIIGIGLLVYFKKRKH